MIREGYEIANRFGHRPFVYQFLYAALEADLRTGSGTTTSGSSTRSRRTKRPGPSTRSPSAACGPCELRCVETSRRPRRCCAGLRRPSPSCRASRARPSCTRRGLTSCSRLGVGRGDRARAPGRRQLELHGRQLVDRCQRGGSRRSAAGVGRGIRGAGVARQLPRPEPGCALRRNASRARRPRGTMGRGPCRVLDGDPSSHRPGRALLRQPGGSPVGRTVCRPRSRCHRGRPKRGRLLR